MTVEVDNLFKASTISASDLLTQAGSGFYIPAYQRKYSWKKGDISRLFEDIAHGLKGVLDDDESAITFLGTIILIKDQRHETINPLVEGQVPNGVYLVIDGQQRLTTIVLAATELYQTISKLSEQLKGDGPDIVWFQQQAARTLAQLRAMFELDMNVGEGHHKFYPKIIRAFDDTWSWQAAHAVYSSPVAAYLHRTISMERGEVQGSLSLIPPGDLGKSLKVSIGTIRKCIKEISTPDPAKDGSAGAELPTPAEAVAAKERVVGLLGSTFPDALGERLCSTEKDKTTERARELFWQILFSRYLLDRVAFTRVTPKSEDYAFDVFESLNTTGEPLNAVETFKPRVISMEGLRSYEGSSSKASFDRIDAYIDSSDSPKKRQQLVNALLTPHKLAELGDRMSRHLSEQRRYLKSTFERFKSDEERRLFVGSLATLSDYLARVWTVQSPTTPAEYGIRDEGIDDLFAICLNVLQQSNHDITVGPLFRFYAQHTQAEPGSAERAAAYQEFRGAALAITSFFLIWRCTRLGTAGIDARYRALMKKEAAGGEPFARQLREGPVTTAELRTRLKWYLSEDPDNSRKVKSRGDFIKLTTATPLYNNLPRAAQRLLLLLATHDSVDDPSEPGLSRRGSAGILPVLTWSQWRKNFTIEHVAPAPQPAVAGYEDAIYTDASARDRLGNLTLLPQGVNASAGARPWAEKRAMYKALCADTQEEAVEALAELKITADSTTALVTETGYLAHTRSLAKLKSDEWTLAFIDRRGMRLAGLAWDTMAPWLGFEEGS